MNHIENALNVVADIISNYRNASHAPVTVEWHDGTALDADIFTRKLRIPRFTEVQGISEERKMLMRGGIYHEAGHIFLTGYNQEKEMIARSDFPQGALHSIWNALEDRWMERAMRKTFAGANLILPQKCKYYSKRIAKQINDGLDSPLWEALVAMSFMSDGIKVLWKPTQKAKQYIDLCYELFCDWKKSKCSVDNIELAKKILDLIKESNDQGQDDQDSQGQGQDDQGQDDQDQDDQDQDDQDSQEQDDQDSQEQDDQDSQEQEGQGQDDQGQDDQDSQGQGQDDQGQDDQDSQSQGQEGQGQEGQGQEGQDQEGQDQDDQDSQSQGQEGQGQEGQDQGQDGQEGQKQDGQDIEKLLSSELERGVEFENGFFESLFDEELAENEGIIGYRSLSINDRHIYPDHDHQYYKEIRNSISASVGCLSRNLEQALRVKMKNRKVKGRKSGRLDPSRLTQAASGISRNVFFKVRKGTQLDTAIMILIDQSASMGERATPRGVQVSFGDWKKYNTRKMEAAKLASAVCESLDRVGVRFGLIGSTTANTISSHKEYLKGGFDRTNPIVYIHYKDIADTWRSGSGRLGSILYSANPQNNVDGEVINYAHQVLSGCSEKRKIIFSICDGLPDAGHGNGHIMNENLRSTCERVRREGTEVYGFGIATRNPERFYGEENFVELSGDINLEFARSFAKIIGK